MPTDFESFDFDATGEAGSGGFLGMALLALALGAGTALLFAPADGARTRKLVTGGLRELRGGAETALQRVQHELRRREEQRRRQRRVSAWLGLAVGAGLAALLVPESGPNTRRRLVEGLKRRKDDVIAEAERVVREPMPDPEPAA
jgi:gas vesicle protein